MTKDEIVAELHRRGLGTLAARLEEAADAQVIQLHTNVRIELRGPDGQVKQRIEQHNVICTAGKQLVLASGGTSKYLKEWSYVCVGTGAVAAAAGDTALGNESARGLGTVSNPDANTLQIVYTFPAGTATGALTESALDYQNTASGKILARQVFSVINKGASDTLQITWTIT